MFRFSAGLLAFCGFVSACQLDSKVSVPTKLVVDIDAELPVRLRSEQLHVLVVSASDDAGSGGQPLLEHEFRPGTASDGGWPIRIELLPAPADVDRTFSLTATAYDGSRAYVAEARVNSGYVANEVHHVRLVLSAACMSVKCTAAQSCENGTCIAAWRDPAQLPLFWPRAGEGALADAVRADASVSTGVAKPDPCLVNNGGCDPLVRCENIGGRATCSDCPSGFEDPARDGTKCVDIDECKLNMGGCDAAHGRCTNTPGSRDCSCADGYHGDGVRCSLNVQCTADSACGPQAQCRDMAGGARVCVCKPGFEGDGVMCKDIDECVRKLDQCRSNAQCQNTEGSFLCPCGKGFVDTSGTCVDVDECGARLDDCDDDPDACMNTTGGFVCRCPVGYAGDGRGSAGCADIDECASGMACDAKRACVNRPGSFMCGTCDKGFKESGQSGCVDIDECAMDNGGCDSRRACINSVGGSMCGACRDGFVPSGATGCASVNECGQNNGGCDPKRRCIENPGGGHSCGACDPGWLPSGPTGCMDIDECLVANGGCDANRVCINAAGSYRCGDCKPGFTRSGSLGCVDVDECATNNGGCGAHRQCTNSAGSHACGACDSGWMLSGSMCVDIDECSVNNGGCVHRACDDTDGSYSCGACERGYVPKSSSECEADPCAAASCGMGGTCTVMNGVGVCSCDATHVLHEERCVLPCDVPGTCPNAECTNSGKMAQCGACDNGFIKQGNTCVDDPCMPNPCSPGTCRVENNGRPMCMCPDMFEERNGACVMKDPCAGVTCLAPATCARNSRNRGMCECPDGTLLPVGGLCVTLPDLPIPQPGI